MIITHNGTILKHDGTILTKITEVPPQPPSFINTYSLDFDGVDDNVYLQNLTSRKVQTLTMSVWVKPTANARDGIVLNGNTSYGNEGIRIDWVFNTFKTKINGVFYELGPGNGQNNWTHIAIAYDGNTLKRMTNGVQFSDVFVGATINYTNYNGLHLGRSTSGFHIGNIDEFAFWDSDQSANFSTIYNNGIPNNLSSLNPLSWYRMGENGSYKSPQWLIPSNENKDKVSNYSFDFDGVDDYIDCGNSAALKPNIITVSCWVKGSTQTAFTRIISQDGPTGGADAYGFYVTTALNKVVFAIKTDVTGTVTSATSGVVLDNSWHHLVGTYDGSEVILYVDGVAVGSPSAGTSILSYGSGTLTIGCFSEPTALPSYLFNGNIDEVSIFNSVIPIGDLWDGSGEPTTLPSGAVAHYKMGEEANFTSNWLVDNSALTNYSKRSFSFDGIDDYIDTSGNSILNGGTELTVSAWINTADKTKTQIITSTFFGSKYVEMSLISGGLYCWIGNGTSTSNYNVVNSTNLAINNSTWYNFTMVFDGSQPTNDTRLKVYKDGSLLTWTTVRTIPTTLATDLTLNTNIGARNGGSSFSGKIDEVAYWHSLENPLDIYNGGEPTTLPSGAVAHWRMGEEASFNGTNWTIPDNIGTNNGTSNAMTVDDLVGEAPNYSGGGISNAMTIQDRVGDAPNSENNALSYNMDEVDRVEDTPTP